MKSLEDKNVDTICVDQVDVEKITLPRERYMQADLEFPETIKFQREFDYIIMVLSNILVDRSIQLFGKECLPIS